MEPKIYIALPILDEFENLPSLIQCILSQTNKNFILIACVNQPNDWWNDDSKKEKCENNQKSIYYLKQITNFSVHIIDKSSPGNGWTPKKQGVGWARKTCMDYINTIAKPNDIILSLDADTSFESEYFKSITNIFNKNPKATALCNPYYHKLTKNEIYDRAILRYEIYMRYYALNMLRIKSPYAYTALGSAIAVPVWAYQKINGIVPQQSGEDFYFVQQLTKVGEIICYNSQKVYPAARFSDRVPFGTGPAMIKGSENNWTSYPIYSHKFFNEIEEFYKTLPLLFFNDVTSPLNSFLEKTFKTSDLWSSMRKNFKTQDKFIKACHEKVDGLRILQYLRQRTLVSQNNSDEKNLINFINTIYGIDTIKKLELESNFSFQTSTITLLDSIRNFLEQQYYAKMQHNT